MARIAVSKQLLVIGAATATLVVAVGGAFGAFPQSDVATYTGCLNIGGTSGGQVSQVTEGLSPLKPCSQNQRLIHLSGGDITAVKVGSGLTGGGENGEVTIGLNAQQTLPSCSADQVPKWNGTAWACGTDNDTKYTAGTGLDLSTGGAFSVNPDYRLPQNCNPGQFPMKTATVFGCSNGFAPFRHQLFGQVGIPDDGDFHVFATVFLDPGTWVVTVDGQLDTQLNVDAGSGVNCRVNPGTTSGPSFAALQSFTAEDLNASTLAGDPWDSDTNTDLHVMDVYEFDEGTTVRFGCTADEGADGVGIAPSQMVALRLG